LAWVLQQFAAQFKFNLMFWRPKADSSLQAFKTNDFPTNANSNPPIFATNESTYLGSEVKLPSPVCLYASSNPSAHKPNNIHRNSGQGIEHLRETLLSAGTHAWWGLVETTGETSGTAAFTSLGFEELNATRSLECAWKIGQAAAPQQEIHYPSHNSTGDGTDCERVNYLCNCNVEQCL
jgi:hypothetical protein